MGLDINAVQFLIGARLRGAAFASVLMLGRQSLSVDFVTLSQLFEEAGLSTERLRPSQFAEPVFEALGSSQVASMDASAFEGAQYVHDLNLPVPSDLRERFDLVIDGGTLEHVFNFPVALKNAMEMTKVGGRVVIHNCANNLCGHGFYQFSPELFFRAFSEENGFAVERMVIHRVGPYGGWFEVSDPNEIKSRVELITFTPMHLLVEARRISSVPVFERAPQQSDYTVRWESGGSPVESEAKRSQPAHRFASLRRLFRAAKTGADFYRRQSLRNRRFFKPVPKTPGKSG